MRLWKILRLLKIKSSIRFATQGELALVLINNKFQNDKSIWIFR